MKLFRLPGVSSVYEAAEKVGFERNNYPLRLPLTQGEG